MKCLCFERKTRCEKFCLDGKFPRTKESCSGEFEQISEETVTFLLLESTNIQNRCKTTGTTMQGTYLGNGTVEISVMIGIIPYV